MSLLPVQMSQAGGLLLKGLSPKEQIWELQAYRYSICSYSLHHKEEWLGVARNVSPLLQTSLISQVQILLQNLAFCGGKKFIWENPWDVCCLWSFYSILSYLRLPDQIFLSVVHNWSLPETLFYPSAHVPRCLLLSFGGSPLSDLPCRDVNQVAFNHLNLKLWNGSYF